MNYEEFPKIQPKYTPISLDMNMNPIEITNPFLKEIIKKEIETVEVIKEVIVNVPIYIYEEAKKEKKPRKKYDLLKYPIHWNLKIKAKYKAYYFRSRQKGKQFTLSFDEFESFFNMACKFCGSKDKITIDRIDSNIGYELFNCQPCCNTCNVMKHFATEYTFLEKVAQIYHYQLKQS